jgi:pyruvate/2-oxoglutarate dehydrogenase complex dihydrolipoamide dehydrogenase (E3) component
LLTSSGRPGFCLRVLREGEVAAGDEIVTVGEAGERMTVTEVNALLYLPKAYNLYIDPPLGRAGMTEHEARRSDRHVLMGARTMTRVGRAIEKGESQGFMKVLVDADSEETWELPFSVPAATR